MAALTVPVVAAGQRCRSTTSRTSRRGAAPSDINRLSRQRQVTVFANLLPTALAGRRAERDVEASSAALNPGAEYRGASPAGRSELGRAAQNFMLAFVLSLVFMYLILAAQFESWLHPITILLSLPLTLPFALPVDHHLPAVAEHLLGARPAGAVRRRQEELDSADRSREPAEGDAACRHATPIVQASRDRLRPILMTTFAFVAGMIPLIVSSGIGSGTNHAIGFVIFGGQSLALLLTLLVDRRSRYSLFDDASAARVRAQAARSDVTARVQSPSAVAGMNHAHSISFALLSIARRRLALRRSRGIGVGIAAADGRRRRQDGARAQRRSERRPARSADQRHAASPRRPAAFRPTLNIRRQPQQPAAAAVELPHPDADTHRRRDVERRAQPAAAAVRHRTAWRGTPSHTDSNSFLNSYNPLLTSGLSLNVSQPLVRDLSIDAAAAAAAGEPDQPRHRRHAAAREPRAHDRQREERALEPRVGASRTSTRGRRR